MTRSSIKNDSGGVSACFVLLKRYIGCCVFDSVTAVLKTVFVRVSGLGFCDCCVLKVKPRLCLLVLAKTKKRRF